MIRFFLGVLVGVTLTLLYVHLQEARSIPADVIARPAAQGSGFGTTSTAALPQVAVPKPSPSVPVPTAPKANAVATAQQPQPVPSAVAPQSTAEHRDMALGVTTPLPPRLDELHRRVETEPRDPSWSAESERLIRDHLTEHLKSPEFDVVAVECRRSVCEIQVFGYAQDGARKWSEAMAGLLPVMGLSKFEGVAQSLSEKNGKTVMLAIMYGRTAAGR